MKMDVSSLVTTGSSVLALSLSLNAAPLGEGEGPSPKSAAVLNRERNRTGLDYK